MSVSIAHMDKKKTTAVLRANTLSSDNNQFVKQETPFQLFVVAQEKGEKKTKVYNSNGKSHFFVLFPISVSTSPFVVSAPFIFRGKLFLFRNKFVQINKAYQIWVTICM